MVLLANPTITFYTNSLADAPEAVRWVHPVNAAVGGAAGGTVVKTDDGVWSAGAWPQFL